MTVIPTLFEAEDEIDLKSGSVTKSSSNTFMTSFSMSSLLAPGQTETTYTWGMFISLTNSTFVVEILNMPKRERAISIIPITTG